jgi:hypothetical protein
MSQDTEDDVSRFDTPARGKPKSKAIRAACAALPATLVQTLCLNIQTTGLKPDTGHLLQIAAVVLGDGGETIHEQDAYLILPEDASIDEGALKIHQDTGLWGQWEEAMCKDRGQTVEEFFDTLMPQLPPTKFRILCSSQGAFLDEWMRVKYPRLLSGPGRICTPGKQVNPNALCLALGVDPEPALHIALDAARQDASIVTGLRACLAAVEDAS